MLSSLFGLSGRIGRIHFWLVGILLPIVLFVVIFAPMGGMMGPDAGALMTAAQDGSMSEDAARAGVGQLLVGVGMFFIVPFLVALWLMLSAQVQRLHDLDRSGWWVIAIGLVPVALDAMAQETGTILSLGVLLYLGFWPGTDGPNRFGGGRRP